MADFSRAISITAVAAAATTVAPVILPQTEAVGADKKISNWKLFSQM